MLSVEEDALTPYSLDDLVASNQLAIALRQQNEQFHRDFFEFEDAISPTQLITAAVELEFRESRYPR